MSTTKEKLLICFIFLHSSFAISAKYARNKHVQYTVIKPSTSGQVVKQPYHYDTLLTPEPISLSRGSS